MLYILLHSYSLLYVSVLPASSDLKMLHFISVIDRNISSSLLTDCINKLYVALVQSVLCMGLRIFCTHAL